MNIVVQTSSQTATTGVLFIGQQRFDCTLGRTGVTLDKSEGDGKTPVGTYPFRYVLYRADRIEKPETGLPVHELTPDTGWCEDPAHDDYNKQITLPHPSVHDRMTRDDNLYDICVIIGYNDAPVTAGKGSAIFMHLARPDFTPTAGCVGLRFADLVEVLRHLDSSSLITVLPPPDSRP
ncbi:MAG: L,D-transpeptidase catalytic domain [Alphaproteobacteria bacterium]|jgi:L,D-peptidoglycan transpeptidase YkuD (ErfK/YbiS/YcfS/YnhG family)|nr:L,D-transpeptidase catalytic domain [Alphaproteobacteria bacterium]